MTSSGVHSGIAPASCHDGADAIREAGKGAAAHFDARPWTNAAAKASPAPTGSATCTGTPGAAYVVVTDQHRAAARPECHARGAPSVPSRPGATERLRRDGSSRWLVHEPQLPFVEFDDVRVLEQLSHQFRRLEPRTQVHVVEPRRVRQRGEKLAQHALWLAVTTGRACRSRTTPDPAHEVCRTSRAVELDGVVRGGAGNRERRLLTRARAHRRGAGSKRLVDCRPVVSRPNPPMAGGRLHRAGRFRPR